MPEPDRTLYFKFSEAVRKASGVAAAADAFFSPDAVIHVVHPFNDCVGCSAYVTRVLEPLGASFESLHRRDDIVMAGTFEGDRWISATGYYAGHFVRDWIGITAPERLCFLRYGEFHRMVDGRAVESFIFLDIPELMLSCGQWPIATGPGHSRGYTGLIPAPADSGGILRSDGDPAEADRSCQLVTDMLAHLATSDQSWRPYWHPDMAWYGPGAFGSFVGIDEFAGFQVPFESQFEGWSGGSSGNGHTWHFARFGDADYACSGGWPSVTGVNVKPFLGKPASNERVFMRVCDWWRREGDLLVENWVFVDVPHLLKQLGDDPFAMMENAV